MTPEEMRAREEFFLDGVKPFYIKEETIEVEDKNKISGFEFHSVKKEEKSQ